MLSILVWSLEVFVSVLTSTVVHVSWITSSVVFVNVITSSVVYVIVITISVAYVSALPFRQLNIAFLKLSLGSNLHSQVICQDL